MLKIAAIPAARARALKRKSMTLEGRQVEGRWSDDRRKGTSLSNEDRFVRPKNVGTEGAGEREKDVGQSGLDSTQVDSSRVESSGFAGLILLASDRFSLP